MGGVSQESQGEKSQRAQACGEVADVDAQWQRAIAQSILHLNFARL